ncbi:MAG TPA: DUF1761 domain-containing protein [Candidatus Andersenbacteria bacterium]|nr:DUF1761 domain-containing protein [Candidatus Andersenbacteria bacterium]
MYAVVLPLLLGGVVSTVIGAVWYSPALFGTQWMKMMGMKKGDMKPTGADMMPLMIGSFLAQLLMGYVLWSLMKMLGAAGPTTGAQLAFLTWLGFVATTSLVNAIYGKKPMKLFLIDVGYHLASLLSMGVIFGLMG